MAYQFNHEGYDLSGYDQDLVKQAQGGSAWGPQDQARYDKLVKEKGKSQSQYDFNHEGYDLSGYDQDLVHQAQGGKNWDELDQARYDKLVKAKGKAQVIKNQGSTGKPTNPIDNTTVGNTDSVPNNQEVTQKQNVNQDNDINTTVTGDKNTVITEQDNSIRQYGGDNRSFTYNGGKGGNRYEDTPVSMATMAGFYDVDDSPAAQARFNDMYTTMNRDNQKRYAGDAMKTYAKYGKVDARSYTDQSMENALNRGIQYSFDRADRQTGHVFGDIWNNNYITEEWKMPSDPDPIESNAAEIAKDAKKDIEDI